MNRALAAVFWRDLLLARRIGGGGATGVVFFLCLVTVIPFAVGPDLDLLSRIGPAILWIAALLSTLLGLDRLFGADHEDGSLDLLRAGNAPLELVVATKASVRATAGLTSRADALQVEIGPQLESLNSQGFREGLERVRAKQR